MRQVTLTVLLLFVPLSLSASEPTLPPFASAEVVDAALVGRGHVYLFSGHRYFRYTKGTQGYALDSGYPLDLPGNWQGLPERFTTGVDAALYNPDNGKTYLFRGPEYVRLTGVQVEAEYPKKITEGWKEIPSQFVSGIDAALYRGGHVYLFKGPHYVRYTQLRIDSPGRRDLPGGWGLPSGWDYLDAATMVSTGQKAYLFNSATYARLSDVTLDPGYPLNTSDYWPGIVDGESCLSARRNASGFAEFVSTAHTLQSTEKIDCEEFDTGYHCVVATDGGAKSTITWANRPSDPAYERANCASVQTTRGGSSERRPGELCNYSCTCASSSDISLERVACTPGLPTPACVEGDCHGDESETWAELIADHFVNEFVGELPTDANFRVLCEDAPEQRLEPCRVLIDRPEPRVIHVNLLHPDEGEACAEAWDEIENLCRYHCSTDDDISTVHPIPGECSPLAETRR